MHKAVLSLIPSSAHPQLRPTRSLRQTQMQSASTAPPDTTTSAGAHGQHQRDEVGRSHSGEGAASPGDTLALVATRARLTNLDVLPNAKKTSHGRLYTWLTGSSEVCPIDRKPVTEQSS
jgi:hypothetical protein